MKGPIQLKFGKRVRSLREASGYSQEEFALKCKLHRTYIGCIERGEKNITIVNVEKIAKALNISIGSLFDGKKHEKENKMLLIIEELQANNNSLEAALAASDSYVEPCKKLQLENQKLKKI